MDSQILIRRYVMSVFGDTSAIKPVEEPVPVKKPVIEPTRASIYTPWLEKAKAYIGLREIVGIKHAPLIVQMWARIKMAGIKDDETPWCAAFVGSCLEEAGIQSTRTGWALDYAKWGQRLDYPMPGAIAYKKRTNSAGKIIGGHVAFVAGRDELGRIMLLGGNQGNKVGIDPFGVSGIMGYRWPNGYPLLARAPLPLVTGGKTSVTEA
jgi:uncharacterized protein (TIGR02594 family)